MDRVTSVHRLAELWCRMRDGGEDVCEPALEVASEICRRGDAPTGILSVAWGLVAESHHRAGGVEPDGFELARARSASLSARHASSMMLEVLAEQLRSARPPVVVLSEIGVCQRLLGRWDLVPPTEAVVMSLAGSADEDISGGAVAVSRGVHWAGPGRLAVFLEDGREGMEALGCAFDVPPVEVMVPRFAVAAANGSEVGAFLLAVSARCCGQNGSWQRALEVTEVMGGPGQLRRAMGRWKLNGNVGVAVPGNILGFVQRVLGR